MAKKSVQASLETTLLHGGPFSENLFESVLTDFIDELEDSLHDDADDALICVVEDDNDVAMLLIEWDGADKKKTLLSNFWCGIHWEWSLIQSQRRPFALRRPLFIGSCQGNFFDPFISALPSLTHETLCAHPISGLKRYF